ncbi:MAG TPA: HAMP domain-containing sensor histidine kinase [Gammaproteobacteria bacterium]
MQQRNGIRAFHSWRRFPLLVILFRMGWLIRLRSLNVLVLVGFALVALPVIFALGLMTTYVDALARQSEEVVLLSGQTTRNAQMLLEQITSLERNARQYRVVGDPGLLTVYENRHERLLVILAELQRLLPEPLEEIPELRETANDLLETFQQYPHSGPEVAEVIKRFEFLNKQGDTLTVRLAARTDEALEALQDRADVVQHILYWQATALIPLVLLLAALFTVLIARPIRQLGNAIRQLGEGDVGKPIAVRGPVDLEDLGQRLDWLRRRLIDLEQEKNTFLSHMSHELKTPLANIREGVELLMDGSVGDLTGGQKEVTEILQSNSLGLQKQIEDLLNFNAWQDMKARLQYNECGLREIVLQTVKQHQLSINRMALHMNVRVDELRIYADCDKLKVMIDNLLSNAVKFSPQGGTITVEAMQDGGWVDIHVIDEGPGIPESERDSVFEAFYQGRQVQHGHVRGTGIGLAVVRECARIHHGYVEILGGEKPGAHFHVRLPKQPL